MILKIISENSPEVNGERLLESLINLQGSTTCFLEFVRKETLKVQIVSQTETVDGGAKILDRVILLYFTTPQRPLLYCKSRLCIDLLSNDEYDMLRFKKMPMGKIFDSSGAVITKKNITIARVVDSDACRYLFSNHGVYQKKYDYIIGGRNIGPVLEFFSAESLIRI